MYAPHFIPSIYIGCPILVKRAKTTKAFDKSSLFPKATQAVKVTDWRRAGKKFTPVF